MTKRIAFKTLGCRLNQFETDAIANRFHKNGYRLVDFQEDADVYVVNTCTVTNQSDSKSRNIIRQASGKNPGALTVVTGCMVNNPAAGKNGLEDVDYMIDNERKSSLFSIIDAHYKGEIVDPASLEKDLFAYRAAEETFHTRSLIKIQDGCDNFCTFCIVPNVRGRAVSRPVKEIMENIRQVLDFGYREIVITGVNIGRYHYGDTRFDDLIEMILKLEGDFRLRISSMEPDGFGQKFIDLLDHPGMTPHLHLCLQSGSEKILLQMRRMYTLASYRNMIDTIRNKQPDFNFTTDIIVGFPGESPEDFEQSCRLVQDTGFSHVHTFKYSRRKGTRADRMKDQVPEKVKTERSRIIRNIAEENKKRYRESFIDKKQTVLVERSQNGLNSGYGEHYVPVEFKDPGAGRNEFHKVRITGIKKVKEPILVGEKIN